VGISLIKPQPQEVHHESLPSGRFPFAVPQSQLEKKIPSRPVSLFVDKETVDEIIFRTTNMRNRLMLELMARGGMRIGEVLNLRPADIQERSLAIQNH
jgi:integrase